MLPRGPGAARRSRVVVACEYRSGQWVRDDRTAGTHRLVSRPDPTIGSAAAIYVFGKTKPPVRCDSKYARTDGDRQSTHEAVAKTATLISAVMRPPARSGRPSSGPAMTSQALANAARPVRKSVNFRAHGRPFASAA